MSGVFAVVASGGNTGRVSLTDCPATVSDSVVFPDSSNAYLIFKADGTIVESLSSGNTVIGNWLEAGVAGAFDIVVTVGAGALQSGAAGTYNLGTDRQFGCDRSIVGANGADVTIKLRYTGGSVDLASKAVSFSATVTV